ncbi:hypothetical protein Y032_0038g3592 [Ancylostoma ceylanicum]|uniref:Uncharacterized protein n=1 Tax=Ancylostoma ceylanicum TaxID=53326 RepID=A0A016UIR5_9BILA|nr:hypothetical protein Y032_0038g3592 [Ancylostoma ceylanicum]
MTDGEYRVTRRRIPGDPRITRRVTLYSPSGCPVLLPEEKLRRCGTGPPMEGGWGPRTPGDESTCVIRVRDAQVEEAGPPL